MIKFSKEEINLCKQVAKKHRKSLCWGDWYYFQGNILLVWSKPEPVMDDSCIPLWTISDCLDFLKERYDDVNIGSISGGWDAQVSDAYNKVWHPEVLEDIRGKTPLEACLKAVIEVLK